MPHDSGDASGDSLTPQEAFSLLGNEYRADIIRALGAAQGTSGPRVVLSFSDLYAEVDPSIATSQFNYHLQKLVGPFIDRTPDGYRLRHEAVSLYRTIMAGAYTKVARTERFNVGSRCFNCDSAVEATYADRRFSVACSACDRTYSDTTVPPSVVDGEEDALLSRIDQFLRHRIMPFSKGVCSICANDLDTQLLPPAESPEAWADQLDVFVHRSCGHCGSQQYMSVGLSLLYDAGLIAFFENHGIDVTETPIWELEFAMTDRYVTVRSTEPWEVLLSLQREGDTLDIVVDGDLRVVSRSRRS